MAVTSRPQGMGELGDWPRLESRADTYQVHRGDPPWTCLGHPGRFLWAAAKRPTSLPVCLRAPPNSHAGQAVLAQLFPQLLFTYCSLAPHLLGAVCHRRAIITKPSPVPSTLLMRWAEQTINGCQAPAMNPKATEVRAACLLISDIQHSSRVSAHVPPRAERGPTLGSTHLV